MPATNDSSSSSGANDLFVWDEISRLADELVLDVDLARARDRLRAFEPRLSALEQWVARNSEHASEAVAKELAAIRDLVKKLRIDIAGN
jgi:hypothetical protein